MFKKILFPTDFSDVSKKARAYIKKLKEAETEEVIVLHVIDWEPGADKLPDNLRQALIDQLEGQARKELQSVEADLKESGFTVKAIIERGKPVKNILAAEIAWDVSAVVIGSHGKSNVKKVFLGSISQNVIRRCKSAVLVIKR
jgi:nucleotide-binding universal stress UspA family protein